MSLAAAIDAMSAAYDARDVAEAHAVADVRRQYAGVIARRVQEYQDAARREDKADGRSAVALGNEREAI